MATEEANKQQAEDRLILVDTDDNVLGWAGKAECHRGEGQLHRAFSVFIFNADGRLLLQQRSALKPLWPGYWSNSVCSHPRKDEKDLDAALRRLKEEIGVDITGDGGLQFLFKFCYRASYLDVGSEHELCSVYIGRSDAPVQADPAEISQWTYIDPGELDRDMAAHPEKYSPWFKIEWQRIRRDHGADLDRLLA